MRHPAFEGLQIEDEDLTVEEWLQLQCDLEIAKLMKHSRERILAFREEAKKIREDLEQIVKEPRS